MRKFFCYYNNLTQRTELSPYRNIPISRKIQIEAENTLLPKIKENIQALYENIVLIKEQEKDENKLDILDETELMISNLYYSLFASPLELIDDKKSTPASVENCNKLINDLMKEINIPEYNRVCQLIKNNLENI